MQKSSAQLMLFVLALGLLLMREARRGAGDAVETAFAGWLSSNSQYESPTAPLTLVEINDSALQDKRTHPWAPLDVALFFQAVLQFNPGVVAVEHELNWDKNTLPREELAKLPEYESILHNFLLRAPKVLLGARLGIPDDPDILTPMQPVPLLRHVEGGQGEIPEFSSVENQPGEELRLSTTPGFTNLPSRKSPVRKVPLLFRYRGEVVPSFVLQSVIMWNKLTPEDIRVETGSRIVLGDRGEIPIDRSGATKVDFKSQFTRLGSDELLLAVELMQAKQPVDAPVGNIKNNIVLLARTDKASRTLQFPGGRAGSPGELFATAIATIQNHACARRAPVTTELAVLAALMALGWVLAKRNKPAGVMIALFSAATYLLGSLLIFGATRVAAPILMPSCLLAFLLAHRLLGHSSSTNNTAPQE